MVIPCYFQNISLDLERKQNNAVTRISAQKSFQLTSQATHCVCLFEFNELILGFISNFAADSKW